MDIKITLVDDKAPPRAKEVTFKAETEEDVKILSELCEQLHGKQGIDKLRAMLGMPKTAERIALEALWNGKQLPPVFGKHVSNARIARVILDPRNYMRHK